MQADQLRQVIEEQLKLSRTLRQRVQELEAQAHAPLAVVGMALRLPPDLNSPEDYWRFLLGDDVPIKEIPDDRPSLKAAYDPVSTAAGRSYVGRAAFRDDVASFDASFFGISDREARALDPQQRMLLETAWEAMERAGIPVRRQDRLNAGVFVGIMAAEYGERLTARHGQRVVDPYFATGGGHCFAAGRVSYVMGLSGPAASVDTACSASLVALHFAAQSLRRGECRYALVGGSNLIFSPDLMVALCQAKALSPKGRSRPFAAAADGYGRGEGVGMLVLMRLADAERERRPILAVVRGTAVNHDGASSGLTVPSGPAQQEVIRAALADGGLAPEDIGYVEAHGTGTTLGDPIEVGALDAVLGSGARNRTVPLAVGSVKGRLGHLEAAAGVAGLIKLILMLRHGLIPAAMSDDDGPLNPLIPWSKINLSVPRQPEPWSPRYPRRLAGISAFGLSGTNAHAILESYEAPRPEPAGPPRPELLTLSAKDATALGQLAVRLGAYLENLDQDVLPSACHTMRAGRTPFAQRVAVVASTPAQMATELAAAVRAAGDGTHIAPVLSVTLHVNADETKVAPGVAAILAAYPRLGQGLDAGAAPQHTLQALVQRLGLRVRSSQVTGRARHVARLEWPGGDRPLISSAPEEAPVLLLRALAALYPAGVELKLDALCAPGSVLLGDLPTYAFQHRRFWIDEPDPSVELPSVDVVEPVVRKVAAGPVDPELVEEFLFHELASVLKAEGELDSSLSFLEVGGDSFTGMLLTKSIQQQYGVDVPGQEFVAEMPLAMLITRLGELIVDATRNGTEERV
jgi:3-oxoacyl-[acyl-carrier-protein] synthase II